MESLEETFRLEVKTAPEAVREQGRWCGLQPGLRVLDAGCGSGKATAILHDIVQPGGEIVGIDFSEERIRYAKRQHGLESGIYFLVRDLREPLNDMGMFDLIWVRFVLEYFRAEGPNIIRNLDAVLKPGGYLCLLDLDHNCLNHYEIPKEMERMLFKVMARLEQEFNFDPYSGRKLYSYVYDLGYQNIQLRLMPHHLMYGEVREEDIFNWKRKVEVVSGKTRKLFEQYPGGHKAFFADFTEFFQDPRRFTYTPLIMCKGMKPLAP
jgi:ubiquinone/menaquinone biosynthesis C-methylase UbiE